MEANKPALRARKGGAIRRAIKTLLSQLCRPFARQQMDFNDALLAVMSQLTGKGGLLDRLDDLEHENIDLRQGLENLTQLVRDVQRACGNEHRDGQAAIERKGDGRLQATPQPAPVARTLAEAIEEGFFLRNVSPGKFNVLDEMNGWDVLVVLDACRFDAFERVNHLPGKLAKRISAGSHTATWLKHTFAGREQECRQIVYLAANPHVSPAFLPRLGVEGGFAHIDELWRTHWDAEHYTVMPEAAFERLVALMEKFPIMLNGGRRPQTTPGPVPFSPVPVLPVSPSYKFIVHLLQPHEPFVGRTRIEVPSKQTRVLPVSEDGTPLPYARELSLLADGLVTHQQIYQAYDDNLRRALEALEHALPRIPGRVVVTADHGELLGEYGMVGHYEEMYVPELIEVPYFVCEQTR